MRNLSGIVEDWTQRPKTSCGIMTDECIKLETLHCPTCPAKVPIGKAKLRDKKGKFSKLK